MSSTTTKQRTTTTPERECTWISVGALVHIQFEWYKMPHNLNRNLFYWNCFEVSAESRWAVKLTGGSKKNLFGLKQSKRIEKKKANHFTTHTHASSKKNSKLCMPSITEMRERERAKKGPKFTEKKENKNEAKERIESERMKCVTVWMRYHEIFPMLPWLHFFLLFL